MNDKYIYRISPSLLNKFSDWLNAGDDWDRYWGDSQQPPQSREDYERSKHDELIAYLNGDPQPPMEEADRGTCLNEIIDCLLGNASREDVTWERQDNIYVARKGDFVFRFDGGLVDSLTLTFKTSVAQYHLCHGYRFEGGVIYLHGYADYIFPTMIWDLKTTGKYAPEKYSCNWQRHVYPVIAVDSQSLTLCERFTFLALECRTVDGVITGKTFAESYDVNIEDSRATVLEFATGVVVPWIDRWRRDGIIGDRHVMPLEPRNLGEAADTVSHMKGGAV